LFPNLRWIIFVNDAIFGIASAGVVPRMNLQAASCGPKVPTLRHFSSNISGLSWRKNASCQGKQRRLLKMNMSAVHGRQFSDGSLEGTDLVRSELSVTEPLLAQTIDFHVQRSCPTVLLLKPVKIG